jgi:hypothetical protein
MWVAMCGVYSWVSSCDSVVSIPAMPAINMFALVNWCL